MRSLFPPQPTRNPCADTLQRNDDATTPRSNTTKETEPNDPKPHRGPEPANPPPQGEKWKRRHLVEKRELLPVDLRFGPAAALLVGNVLYFAHYADEDERTHAYDQLLLDILSHEIMAKPGRQFPRRNKPKKKPGKKNKGNPKAQYQRKKDRRQQRRLRRNAET